MKQMYAKATKLLSEIVWPRFFEVPAFIRHLEVLHRCEKVTRVGLP